MTQDLSGTELLADRISRCIETADRLLQGEYREAPMAEGVGQLGRLERALSALATVVERRDREVALLIATARRINAGTHLDEVLEGGVGPGDRRVLLAVHGANALVHEYHDGPRAAESRLDSALLEQAGWTARLEDCRELAARQFAEAGV